MTPAIDFVQVHEHLRRGLAAVDDVCRRLGVEYWIDAGTLLGAARNGRFIAWDDDVDLAMSRTDLDRFLAGAPRELGDDYLVKTPREDRNIGVDAKIYLRGSHVTGGERAELGLPLRADDHLFIDILVADPLARSPLMRKLDRGVAWLARTHAWAGAAARSPRIGSRKRRVWRIASLVPRPFVRLLAGDLDRRMRRRSTGLIGIAPAALYNGHAYAESTIRPVGTIELEGLTVPAPADVDTYLRGMYGDDYLTPPPPEHRRTHATSVWFDGPHHSPETGDR